MPQDSKWAPWPPKQPDLAQWDREVKFAAKVQQALLPSVTAVFGDVSISACCVPHYVVGGDCFDLIDLPDGRLRVVLADVMGKGFGAAMLMTMVRTAARMASPCHLTPGELLARLNDLLFEDLQRLGSFITMVCADYDPTSGGITVAAAGHPAPFLIRAGVDAPERLPVKGVTLGMLRNRTYQEHRFFTRQGDRLVMFSDGMLEAKDSAGKDLAAAGVQAILQRHRRCCPNDLVREVLEEVARFAGHGGIRDDVTVVVAQVGSPEEVGT